MKFFLPTLLFAGLLAMVSCNDMCLLMVFRQCVAQASSSGQPSCSSLDTIKTCVNSGGKACQGEGTEFVNKLLAPLEEICKPGSELNKKFVAQEKCLDGVVSNDAAPCFADLQEQMKNIPQPPSVDDAKKLMKMICDATPKAMNCLYGKAEEKCSKDGRDVVTAFGGPMLEVLQKMCSSLPGGASAISGFSWVVLLSTALLLAIWH